MVHGNGAGLGEAAQAPRPRPLHLQTRLAGRSDADTGCSPAFRVSLLPQSLAQRNRELLGGGETKDTFFSWLGVQGISIHIRGVEAMTPGEGQQPAPLVVGEHAGARVFPHNVNRVSWLHLEGQA